MWPLTTTTFANLGAGLQNLQQYQYPTVQPAPSYPPPERKVEVPVIDREDKAGIFLRNEHGVLVHVAAERLYKAIGLDW